MKKLLMMTGLVLCAMVENSTMSNAQYIKKNSQVGQFGKALEDLAEQYMAKQQAPAQNKANSVGAASATSIEYARSAARACLNGRWEQQPCLKAISENTLVMAANYGAVLQGRGKNRESEILKENCAAATAATKGEYPAYAMRSAYVECANKIYDLTEMTKMSPDLSQYQLLVGAVQCLDKSTTCTGVESGLAKYR